MDIDEIKEYCLAGRIQWTAHVMQRLIKRNISRRDVKEALMNGKIIENYPEDYPYPSCLVLGVTLKSEVLHIVCGIGENRLWIITAYRPDESMWTESFTKRKEE